MPSPERAPRCNITRVTEAPRTLSVAEPCHRVHYASCVCVDAVANVVVQLATKYLGLQLTEQVVDHSAWIEVTCAKT